MAAIKRPACGMYVPLLTLLLHIVSSEIHVEMCNDHKFIPKYDGLTVYDLTRIKKLEQLQIISRHGSRTGQYSVKDIFPNMNTSIPGTTWQCNFTSITSRNYDGHYFMSLMKNYIYGEQNIGFDCTDSQSTWQVIDQHKKNAELIRQYYIGDRPKNLFSIEDVNNIMDEIFIARKYKKNNTPYIKIASSDFERTYSTASIFMTYFLKYGDGIAVEREKDWIYNGDKDYLFSYTHDPKSDPYVPQKIKKCKKLKKYIADRGMRSKAFKRFIRSDYVQNFYARWKQEVGTEWDDSDASFKIGENIMWMYCGGIRMVPHIISEELFNMVQNYTIEYRVKLLNNGAASQETTALAAMPFAWILKTLISDHVYYLKGQTDKINGYMEAEQAKLIFHSTRGISTLYFLAALGIGDGREPVYANLVNFEIYSSRDNATAADDEFDGYLFRITKMGKFLPFPGCEQDYMNGAGTLCKLSVFIDRLKDLAMPLKEWEPYCADKVADYYGKKKHKKSLFSFLSVDTEEDEAGGVHAMDTWHFVVGVLFGAVLMWMMDRMKYFRNMFKTEYTAIN